MKKALWFFAGIVIGIWIGIVMTEKNISDVAIHYQQQDFVGQVGEVVEEPQWDSIDTTIVIQEIQNNTAKEVFSSGRDPFVRLR